MSVSLSWNNASGATINAADTSLASVQTAINSASDGDTVSIPAGTSRWDTYAVVSKAIVIIGAGTGQTVLQDSSVNPNSMFALRPPAGKVTRLSGIQFDPGTRTSIANAVAVATDGGNTSNPGSVRIDHCKFNQLKVCPIQTGNTFGVIDHNDFQLLPNTIGVNVNNAAWGGGAYGDKSYADLSYLGTDKFIFIEDNTFTGVGGTVPEDAFDGLNGGRLVFRYNTLNHCVGGTHGTESGGRRRGFRAIEIYNNTFINGAPFGSLPNMRSGTGVYYNNTATGFANPVYIQLGDYREIGNFGPWGPADGTNLWDVNQSGGPLYFGKATIGGNLIVTVSGNPWTTNQWVNCTIRKTGGLRSANSFSTIVSNTSNTIRISSCWSGGFSFSPGDTFEICKVIHSLDQPGRVMGPLITGDTPLLPTGWNNQVTEPFYEWNNTYDVGGETPGNYTGNINFSGSHAGSVTPGVDYLNDTVMPGYTPYTYPHPLAGGANAPSPPANLRIQ